MLELRANSIRATRRSHRRCCFFFHFLVLVLHHCLHVNKGVEFVTHVGVFVRILPDVLENELVVELSGIMED